MASRWSCKGPISIHNSKAMERELHHCKRPTQIGHFLSFKLILLCQHGLTHSFPNDRIKETFYGQCPGQIRHILRVEIFKYSDGLGYQRLQHSLVADAQLRHCPHSVGDLLCVAYVTECDSFRPNDFRCQNDFILHWPHNVWPTTLQQFSVYVEFIFGGTYTWHLLWSQKVPNRANHKLWTGVASPMPSSMPPNHLPTPVQYEVCRECCLCLHPQMKRTPPYNTHTHSKENWTYWNDELE